MTSEWVDLDLAVRRVLAGEIENAMCAVGVLAGARAPIPPQGFKRIVDSTIDALKPPPPMREHPARRPRRPAPGLPALDHDHHRAAVREAWRWLEFTGLQDKADALPDELNLHQRKFLELARALAARPRLVLLDEVLSGLTPSEINEAIELIRRIRDQGSTIVFVEHVMRAVMALTDRIVVLNHGKLIAQGVANEVMQDAEVVNAYLGKPAYA